MIISAELPMDQSLGAVSFQGRSVWTNGAESSSQKFPPETGSGPWMALPKGSRQVDEKWCQKQPFFNGCVFVYLQLSFFCLICFFTYSGGTVSRRDQIQFPG